MGRVRQIKHHSRMWFRPTAIIDSTPRKLLYKIDTAIKMQTPIRIDINIQRSVISRCVDQSNVSGLQEVVIDDDVFLVRSDFDVMRSDCWLDGAWVIESLNVVEVRDIEGCNVVICCEGEVCIFSVLGDIGAGGVRLVTCLGRERGTR
jgi:hypothetical protein